MLEQPLIVFDLDLLVKMLKLGEYLKEEKLVKKIKPFVEKHCP